MRSAEMQQWHDFRVGPNGRWSAIDFKIHKHLVEEHTQSNCCVCHQPCSRDRYALRKDRICCTCAIKVGNQIDAATKTKEDLAKETA